MLRVLESDFLKHFNVKTKVHIVVKICIKIIMTVMKDVERAKYGMAWHGKYKSRAKRKVCRAK